MTSISSHPVICWTWQVRIIEQDIGPWNLDCSGPLWLENGWCHLGSSCWLVNHMNLNLIIDHKFGCPCHPRLLPVAVFSLVSSDLYFAWPWSWWMGGPGNPVIQNHAGDTICSDASRLNWWWVNLEHVQLCCWTQWALGNLGRDCSKSNGCESKFILDDQIKIVIFSGHVVMNWETLINI